MTCDPKTAHMHLSASRGKNKRTDAVTHRSLKSHGVRERTDRRLCLRPVCLLTRPANCYSLRYFHPDSLPSLAMSLGVE